MGQYQGSDWIKRRLRYWKQSEELSPLGVAVADLLGDVYAGIYHLRTSALKRVKWADGDVIEFILSGEMSTWDFNHLTVMTVLAHDRMIRVSIQGVGPGYMRLMFHQRNSREGDTMTRYPTIEHHIDLIRKVHGEPTI